MEDLLMNKKEEKGTNIKRPSIAIRGDIDVELGNLGNEESQTYSKKPIQSSYYPKKDYEMGKDFQTNQEQAISGNKSYDGAFDLRTTADKDQNFEFGNSDSQTVNIGKFKGFGDPKEDMELGELMERGRKQHVFTAGKNKENGPSDDYNDKDEYKV